MKNDAENLVKNHHNLPIKNRHFKRRFFMRRMRRVIDNIPKNPIFCTFLEFLEVFGGFYKSLPKQLKFFQISFLPELRKNDVLNVGFL